MTSKCASCGQEFITRDYEARFCGRPSCKLACYRAQRHVARRKAKFEKVEGRK